MSNKNKENKNNLTKRNSTNKYNKVKIQIKYFFKVFLGRSSISF